MKGQTLEIVNAYNFNTQTKYVRSHLNKNMKFQPTFSRPNFNNDIQLL